MALKPCRECGNQVSDQAETCPNCGIKAPALASPSKSTDAGDRKDDIILALNNVVITSTLAKFNSQTFPINGIGSVTLVAPKNLGFFIFAFVLIMAGAIVLANDGGGIGGFFLFCGAVMVAFGLSRKHGLVIKTASGDVRAMEGDQKLLGTVKTAIERAATMRG